MESSCRRCLWFLCARDRYFVIGIGYELVQEDGNQCGGLCAFGPSIYYNYYWMFDINEILFAHTVSRTRPYVYGIWVNINGHVTFSCIERMSSLRMLGLHYVYVAVSSSRTKLNQDVFTYSLNCVKSMVDALIKPIYFDVLGTLIIITVLNILYTTKAWDQFTYIFITEFYQRP